MANVYSLDNYKLTGNKEPGGPKVVVNWTAMNARKMMFCELCKQEQPFEGHSSINDTMMRCCSCDAFFVDMETGRTSIGTSPAHLKVVELTKEAEVQITTCQLYYANRYRSLGWMVVDITVKSGVPAFAPTWEMVLSYKNGTLTEEQYTREYHGMMQISWRQNKPAWLALLHSPKVCLACYCKPEAFCHRHLLKEYLRLVGEKEGIAVEIIPEVK